MRSVKGWRPIKQTWWMKLRRLCRSTWLSRVVQCVKENGTHTQTQAEREREREPWRQKRINKHTQDWASSVKRLFSSISVYIRHLLLKEPNVIRHSSSRYLRQKQKKKGKQFFLEIFVWMDVWGKDVSGSKTVMAFQKLPWIGQSMEFPIRSFVNVWGSRWIVLISFRSPPF